MIRENLLPRETDRGQTLGRPVLILVAASLAVLIPVTALAIARHGIVGLFASAVSNSASLQIFLDLVVLCLLASVWMWRDSRRSGRRFLPWFALTLAAGSFGPLLYLATGWLHSRRGAA